MARETKTQLRRRAGEIVRALAAAYPAATCSLDFAGPWQLLAATILSAQCTDKKVNQVTPALFARYPNPVAMAAARPAEVAKIIKSLGLFRAKAGHLVACAQKLQTDHAGQVPAEMAELTRLPGVGRKTANCVLVNAFSRPGLMCDTHFCRVTFRLGLHREEKPGKIEAAVGDLLPPAEWGDFSHRIIIHGRQICSARQPHCGEACPLDGFCLRHGLPSMQKTH